MIARLICLFRGHVYKAEWLDDVTNDAMQGDWPRCWRCNRKIQKEDCAE